MILRVPETCEGLVRGYRPAECAGDSATDADVQTLGQSVTMQAMTCGKPVMISRRDGFWEPHKEVAKISGAAVAMAVMVVAAVVAVWVASGVTSVEALSYLLYCALAIALPGMVVVRAAYRDNPGGSPSSVWVCRSGWRCKSSASSWWPRWDSIVWRGLWRRRLGWSRASCWCGAEAWPSFECGSCAGRSSSGYGRRLPPPSRPTGTSRQRGRAGLEFAQAALDRRPRNAGGAFDHVDAAMSQGARFAGGPDPTRALREHRRHGSMFGSERG
jgi:hypothetical protein